MAAITLPLFKNLEFFEDDQESKDRFKQILIEKVQVIFSGFSIQNRQLFIKSSFSEKATKICAIFLMVLMFNDKMSKP